MKFMCVLRGKDDLHRIARLHGVSAGEIMEYNRLSESKLDKGVRVIVDRPSGDRYVVKPFDTLEKIAAKHGVTRDAIKEKNPAASEIFVGQIIYMP